ncbi:DNA cytosine methyltransferase [Pedobacter agri]|uniref:Cytosine-specific methyltransferase n=1 Tax=Pedobacter agri TaxID=454586 RepID=A0A9X3I8G5_9SPHI|nr:DNA cytosine methyltransferase [Pedobacter agri]MCX3264792.1 DNA cytosine methyltransferase [Pedobacter agri]
MNHLSLFSGMGGFDLAAEWMGWENIAHCEWNPFCQQILKYYWPKAISYADITKTDFSIHRGSIDIITGGFPCQPYSTAGKRKGKDDERHLWPHMLRAIREIKPRWVVGENVLGLVGWNGGLVFEEVQADLEAEGYEVQPYILPAASVSAPHKRDRVWFVAYSKSFRRGAGIREKVDRCEWNPKEYFYERAGIRNKSEAIGRAGISPDANYERLEVEQRIGGHNDSKCKTTKRNNNGWEDWPTQSPICDGDDGFPARLDGITFSKWRRESIKGGGNAIVPQVAIQIFKTIEEYEKRI